MEGYREVERKGGRIQRDGKERWKDREVEKGRMEGYREVDRKVGRI
jgi:hypothetical protein